MTTERNDAGVFAAQNFGARIGYGRQAALLLVDFVNGFADPAMLGGGNVTSAIEHSIHLLDAARRAAIPVAFSRIVYPQGAIEKGVFTVKVPSLLDLTEDNPASHVVAALAPAPGELVFNKTQASCFFGTDFAAWLRWRCVDTLLVAGCTTSGCVRASVVDAASNNIRPMVVRECVGDRSVAAHVASLSDMDWKYADVVALGDVSARLNNGELGAMRHG